LTKYTEDKLCIKLVCFKWTYWDARSSTEHKKWASVWYAPKTASVMEKNKF